MASRYSFDWSSLDRQTLFDSMYSINDKIVNKSLRISRFHSLVSQHIKTFLPIRIQKYLDLKVKNNQVYVGGTYCSYSDKKKTKSITVNYNYNPHDKYLKISQKKFEKQCILFADTVLHEIIHMRQFRRRGFKEIVGYNSTAEKTKQRREQSYLGHPDEIGAYSFNIACELNDKFKGNSKKIIAYLNESSKIKLKSGNCWTMYLKAFDYKHTHPIIKRLKKRVIYYITKEQFNKPYLCKDWISN